MRVTGSAAPIGVFDSGVGGLSVLRAIRAALPSEDLLYVADSGHAPYGDRAAEFIVERSSAIAQFLLARQAKALVVACNTATVVAIDSLRAACPVPLVAIEPAIKPAALRTRSGVVGVLATRRTAASAQVARLIEQHARGVRVLLQPCPGLAEQVERGELDSPATRALLEAALQPLLQAGADTLVLGCTHYAFVAPTIRAVAGAQVELIDPAEAVARELVRRLSDQAATPKRRGRERFFASGDRSRVRATLSALWGDEVEVDPLATDAAGARPLVRAVV